MIAKTPRILIGILALCSLVVLRPAQADDYSVTSAQELQAALSATEGGQIVLQPGNYGSLRIEGRHYKAPVVLKAQKPRQAFFEEVVVQDSSNLVFQDVTTKAVLRAEKSTDLAISGCLAHGVLYFRNVARLRIDNCIISGGQYGVLFNSVADFSIVHSRVGKVSEDIMRITGNSHDGLVEGNILDDVISYPPTHPDLIQMFGADGKTPHNITIRRNFLRDIHETGSPKRTAQGIFVSDPQAEGYRDILIEDNVISTRSANTIYINGGQERVFVRNNTLLPGAGDGGAIIRIAKKAGKNNAGTVVENNIAKQILDETQRSKVGRNYLYGRGARLQVLFSGPGARWQDFLPVLGTGADRPGMGATDFLRDLLAAQKPGAKGGPRLGPDWAE